MLNKQIVYLLLASVAACAGFLFAPFLNMSRNIIPPSIDCPSEIDLGDRDVGELAIGRLVITNRGGEDLIIGSVSSSCSCAGLEIDENGTPVSFQELRLHPGESRPFMIRLSVRVQPGESIKQIVSFSTNDPTRSNVQLEILVRQVRGISCSPNSVVFGSIPIGTAVSRTVYVQELGDEKSVLKSVSSSDGSGLTVSIRDSDDFPRDILKSGWLPLGIVDINIRATKVSAINDEIVLHFKRSNGSAVDVAIRVNGRVIRPVEILPEILVLPRLSDSGLVYEGNCICKSSLNADFEVKIDSIDAGLAVEILPSGSNSGRVVNIKVTPGEQGTRKVHLLITPDGKPSFPAEITVHCRR